MKISFFLKILILIQFINMTTNQNDEYELDSYMKCTLEDNNQDKSKIILYFEFRKPERKLTEEEEKEILKEYPLKLYLSRDFLNALDFFDFNILYLYGHYNKNKSVDYDEFEENGDYDEFEENDDYDEFEDGDDYDYDDEFKWSHLVKKKYNVGNDTNLKFDVYKFNFYIENYKDHFYKDIVMDLLGNKMDEEEKKIINYFKIRINKIEESNEKNKIEIIFLVNPKRRCYKIEIDKIFDESTSSYKYSYKFKEIDGKERRCFLNNEIDNENDIILKRIFEKCELNDRPQPM